MAEGPEFRAAEGPGFRAAEGPSARAQGCRGAQGSGRGFRVQMHGYRDTRGHRDKGLWRYIHGNV